VLPLGEADAGIGTEHDQDAAMIIFDMAAILTGERMMTTYTGGRERPSRDEIARLACHYYATRGRRNGQDLDDWLCAEQELTQEDEALARRFRCVHLAEPTIEETRQILRDFQAVEQQVESRTARRGERALRSSKRDRCSWMRDICGSRSGSVGPKERPCMRW
jgi:Protein of unknown function (DUF2934)